MHMHMHIMPYNAFTQMFPETNVDSNTNYSKAEEYGIARAKVKKAK